MWRALSFAQNVHVLHHRRDRGVVAETRDILANLPDGLMQLPHHGAFRLAIDRHALHRCEEAVEESTRARNALIAEVTTLLVGTEEHEVGAEGIGAPVLDVLVGIHDVALRLRHFRAFADDMPVRAKARERLLELE